MARDKFRDPADPAWEQRVNELEEGTGIGEITSAKIAAEAVTPGKLNKEVPGRRLIVQAPFVFKEKSKATNVFFLAPGNELSPEGESGLVTPALTMTEKTPIIFVYLESGYKTTGKTNKMLFEVHLGTNETAPVANFTFGLYKVTEFTGAEKTLKIKTEAILAASKVVFTAPAAKSITQANSGSFAALTNMGTYVFGCEISAETAAKTLQAGMVQLFALNE